MRDETSVSIGVAQGKQPHRGWKDHSGTSGRDQIIPTAKHATSSFALWTNHFFTSGNPCFLCQQFSFCPKTTSQCFGKIGQVPDSPLTAWRLIPCPHMQASLQAGASSKSGNLVPVPIFPPQKVYSPLKAVHLEFQILLPIKAPTRKPRGRHSPHPIGTSAHQSSLVFLFFCQRRTDRTGNPSHNLYHRKNAKQKRTLRSTAKVIRRARN